MDLGKWTIIRPLGQGAFASVYEASHPDLPGSYALKVAPLAGKKVGKSAVSVAANSISNEYTVYHVQLKPTHKGMLTPAPPNKGYGQSASHRWIALELATGGSLESKLKSGPLAWPFLKAAFRQLIDVLQFIHSKGNIFVDINPGNVLFVGPQAKLADFGMMERTLTALPDPATGSRRKPLDGNGTPLYSPTGQLGNGMKCPANDLESLGLLLCVAVGGEAVLPWHSATIPEQIAALKRVQSMPDLVDNMAATERIKTALKDYFKTLARSDPMTPDYEGLKKALT